MEALSSLERRNIGFIPIESLEAAIRRRRLFVITIAHEPAGFILFGQRSGVLRIHQIVVRKDARRILNATALIQLAITQLANKQLTHIACRVADDIEAHLFWQALGFNPIGVTRHSSRSTRDLIIYSRSLPWTPSPIHTSPASCNLSVPGSQATLDHGRCTPRDAEKACGILERRLLLAPPQPNVVNAIDSHWQSVATSLFRQESAGNGNT